MSSQKITGETNGSSFQQTFLFFAIILLSLIFLAASHNNASKNKTASGSSQNATIAPAQVANFLNPDKDIVPGVIYVKFKNNMLLAKGASRTSISSVDALCGKYQVHSIEPVFPFLQNSTKKKSDVLRRVYYVKFSPNTKVTTVCDAFAADRSIEYAEPQFLFKIDALPNDPQVGDQQGQLNQLDLPRAWDIVKGESGEVVVAVVDGGTDWQHEDIEGNIWNNDDEIPNNGIDDDNNGFIDDVRGWNYANNSNNPKGLAAHRINGEHGTRTAGIIGAIANNSLGMAGASWNAKIMPVNAAASDDSSDGTIQFGYPGIAYAAANGADIINTSWGGTVSPGFPLLGLFQDVIDFARENGALVVASAGNGGINNDNVVQLPPNLNRVLSVGSINPGNTRSGFSNYGAKVDVFAPGELVLSTEPGNNYGSQNGTSFSSPYVAAVAALVKTQHPDWTPDQVREQVRVTAINIDAQHDPQFQGLLGKGRINAFRAVTVEDIPAIRFAETDFSGAGPNGSIEVGETINLRVRLNNILADASNINVTLSSPKSKIAILASEATIASLSTGDTAAVNFQFQLQSALVNNELLTFFIDISSGDYRDRDVFDVNPNPPQILSHNTGVLQTTITSKGTIGFLTSLADSNGVGFVLNNFNYLFEGGLVVATGSNAVSNTFRGVNLDQDADFRPASGSFLRLTSPGAFADEESFVVMVDSLADRPIGVQVTQETYAYNSEPFNRFIIFKYTLHNTGFRTFSNLRIGLFFDWDIRSDALDYARFDNARSMGAVQNLPSNPTRIAATKVLSNKGVTGYRALDNRNELDLTNTQNGFTDSEKWGAMSNGIQVTTLNNIDISTLASTGPYEIRAADSVVVAFVVIAAESQADLENSADAAQYLWENGLNPEIKQVKPNISTAVLQNPAASKYADIVVISDRSLEATPAVELTVGGNTSSVPMQRLLGAATLYKGAIEFTSTGAYTITTRANVVLTGADSTQTRTYQVALAKPGVLTSLSVNAGQAILSLGENAVSTETYFIGNFEEIGDETFYTFGPAGRLQEQAEMTLSYSTQKFIEPGKLFIYYQNGEKWEALPTQVYEASGLLKAKTEKLGKFKLVYDGLFGGDNTVPSVYALKQNYPNPFNPATTIEYDLPQAGEVALTIYNQLGQVIKTLVRNQREAGHYKVIWDARNDDGRKVSSGIYFYQIKASGFVQTNKMVLMQ